MIDAPTDAPPFIVKCDECKSTIRRTADAAESVQGGRCDNCASYPVGAILESSWGYEQTNIDFYRIERRTNDTVWLIPLRSRTVEGGMVGTVLPDVPCEAGDGAVGYPQCRFDGKLLRRRLARDKDGRIIGVCIKHGWCSAWDGKPSHYTAYA